MDIEWGSFWAGVIALPVAVGVIAALGALVLHALDRNLGIGDCVVCDEGFTCEIGDYTRLGIWIRSRRHNWILRNKRAHREAWANNRWNPYRAPGVADDDGRIAATRRPKPSLLRRAWWAVVA